MRNQFIFIKNLKIPASVGIYDFEKEAKQLLVISIVLEIKVQNFNIKPEDLTIDDVVSYENIRSDIHEIVASKHYDLLEEIAERIISSSLEYQDVVSIDVSIEKPDIFEDCEAVGVRLVESRDCLV